MADWCTAAASCTRSWGNVKRSAAEEFRSRLGGASLTSVNTIASAIAADEIDEASCSAQAAVMGRRLPARLCAAYCIRPSCNGRVGSQPIAPMAPRMFTHACMMEPSYKGACLAHRPADLFPPVCVAE